MKSTITSSLTTMKRIAGISIFAGILLAASCNRNPSFKIEGTIEGGNGETVVLEKPGFHGEWTSIDSTHISNGGKFSMKSPRPTAPEIYRLRIADSYVYFPVDSTETISLQTELKSFGHLYSLTGSSNAERLAHFESDFARFGASPASADSTSSFKRRIYIEYIQPSPASILSYHILTKTMADGTPLYDIQGEDDYRYLAAVATGYRELRPEDPHTAMLEAYALQAMKEKNRLKGKRTEIHAQEISMPGLTLNDEKGQPVSITDIAGKGEPVILVFSSLTDAGAPARNRELMDRYKKGGIRIYQVSFDADQYAWRESALNLPWTTVNDPSATPRSIIDYNLGTLPVYYMIDGSGNLVKRGDSLKAIF